MRRAVGETGGATPARGGKLTRVRRLSEALVAGPNHVAAEDGSPHQVEERVRAVVNGRRSPTDETNAFTSSERVMSQWARGTRVLALPLCYRTNFVWGGTNWHLALAASERHATNWPES